MSSDVFYFIGFVFAILILFILPKTKEIFEKNIPEVLGVSSAYFYLLADIKSDSFNLIILDYSWRDINSLLVFFGIALALLAVYLNFKIKSKFITNEELVSELEITNKKLEVIKKEYYKLCSDNLRIIFKSFFDLSNGCGRVSVYKYDGDVFKLLGRYSNNPLYNKKGRDSYPSNEGFIALGWANEIFEIYNIPQWTKNGKDYKNAVKELCNISDSTLKNIKMKSCSFFIYRLDNEDSRPPLGIVVVEQLQSSQIDHQNMNEIFSSNEQQLSFLIKSMKSI
ncbi:hypothetical protein M9Q43_07290 [Flavobacterium sp. HXWNR29]|uniref:hypothetical protein n=1 Tax=Flavobacterium TaxID=237 RepID=UPI00047A7179|nr:MULTISPECIES: hypothetical protein [Flavobacterium]MCU4188967.1 hypothetical protein [Flavobacterium sp. HXWNR29]